MLKTAMPNIKSQQISDYCVLPRSLTALAAQTMPLKNLMPK